MKNPPKYALLFLITTVKLLGAIGVGLALLVLGYGTWILWSFELWVKGWPDE